MNIKFFKKSNVVLSTFHCCFDIFIEKFATEISVNISSEDSFDDIEISISRKTNNKKIIFYYTEGYNVDDEFINIFQFSIKTLNAENIKRNCFYLQDYSLLTKMPYNSTIKPNKDIYAIEKELKIIFEQVVDILNEPKLHNVLFSDEWIEVPINWTPYK